MKSYRMPPCSSTGCPTEVGSMLDGIFDLPPRARGPALALAADIGATELCTVLHAMRRWYSYNCWNNAKKILPHAGALSPGMDLDPRRAVGAYRGFRVPKGSSFVTDFEEGDVLSLPVERNGGCSSWTMSRAKANLFSGSAKTYSGIVIQLEDARGVRPFIAPPSHSESWFNELYARTMNRAYRFSEEEYAIYGKKLTVRIVAIKR